MDGLPEKLRALTNNRYFAYIAVIFFAFLTALIFAVMALQGSVPQSGDAIRSAVQTGQAGSQTGSGLQTSNPQGSTGSSGASQADSTTPQSPLDRIISIFTGRRTNQPDSQQTGTSQGQSGSTQQGGAIVQPIPGEKSKQESDALNDALQSSTTVPSIEIDRFVLTAPIPPQPQTMRAYRLQTNYSDNDVEALARATGFGSIDAVEKRGSVSQLYDLSQGSYLGFDKSSGTFTYYSDQGFLTTQSGTSPTRTAELALAHINRDDPMLSAHATYKRTDAPGSIFVEFHRDWSAMGAPLLDPLGMLNLTQSERLASLSFSKQPDNTHPDARIISTSDDTDGFARPDTFNTLTVQISESDNRIRSIASTIPEIVETVSLPADSLVSPIDAFDAFKRGVTSLALTSPAGEGTVSLSDVYSGGVAKSTHVDVGDFELAYATTSTAINEWLCPSYAFRSFGKVQTGFDVQYAHTVPASSDPRCQGAVLGASQARAQLLAQNSAPLPTPDSSQVVPTAIVGGPDKDSSSLQYGTLVFKVQAIIDTPVSECPTDFNHSYVVKQTNEYIDYIAWLDENTTTKLRGLKPRKWYYVRKKRAGIDATLESLAPSYTKTDLYKFRSVAMFNSILGSPNVAPLDQKFHGLETISCQHIVTASPWIHIYSDAATDLRVELNPVGGIAYVNPPFTDDVTSAWDVTADRGNPVELFWEYNRYNVLRAYEAYVSESGQPEAGFTVSTVALKDFMAGLSDRIGLNETEKVRVLSELERDSMRFDSPFVRVAFVDQAFLNAQLPLNVQPTPDSMHRIYFELSPRDHFERGSLPNIPQVVRSGVTIVETGFVRTHR